MSNIFINNYNKIQTKLSLRDYWDFSLAKEKDPVFVPDGSSFFGDCIISYLDFNNPNCISGETVYGLTGYTWGDSFNSGYVFENIGLTGIDNGIVTFDKDNITNNEFLNLVTGSTFSGSTEDVRLTLKQVTGNTKQFIYPLGVFTDINNNQSIRFDGGFFQGIYKNNDNYSILPTSFNKEISFEFVLTPDFSTSLFSNTLNEKYPENKGFFFYMGVRSENKFWYDYNKEDDIFYQIKSTGDTYPIIPSGDTLYTKDGFDVKLQGVWETETDNNFILYNQTSSGNTICGFDNTKTYFLTGQTLDSPNYYLYANQTPTGYTADCFCSEDTSGCTSNVLHDLDQPNTKYSIIDDVVGNSIGFRIKDNGSVGYRTIIKNCDDNQKFSVEEQYSISGVTSDNKQTLITVRLVLSDFSKCGNSNRTFKMFFYVDSKLVLVSKELPELNFRQLNDLKTKQESIPFNISIGGGSQGLCDMVGFNSTYFKQYLLPIEQYFGGTFIGNIDKFRIYNCKYDFSKINNNYKYEFNPPVNNTYIEPTISFDISGLTLQTYETFYFREKGNTDSILGGNITLNKANGGVYSLLTGYKLYYNENNTIETQINGLFPVNQMGGVLSGYTHQSNTLSGVTTLKYTIEVFDTTRTVSGTKQSKTIIFDNMIFFGNSNLTPTSSVDVRGLSGSCFNSGTTTVTLQTGTSNKVFSIAMPSNRTITSVFDQNAMFVDLTSNYILNQMMVADGGGHDTPYNVYTMINSIPYSTSHNHIITIS